MSDFQQTGELRNLLSACREQSLRLERRAVASEAAVGRLRTALEELVAYQNGSPLPSYDEGWANAMRLADEALHGEGEK